jgi:hypothetical protein
MAAEPALATKPEAVAGRAAPAAASPGIPRAALTVLVVQLALAAWVFRRGAIRVPYSDELGWIERWIQLQSHHDFWAYLLIPTNLHRLPWTLGLLAFDLRVFGGTNLPLILSGVAALALMAWLAAREAGRSAAAAGFGLAAGVLAVLLVLMAGNLLDAVQPICVNYVHGAALAVLAMVLAEGEASPGLGPRRIAALLAAAAAALGDAVALAVWPVLAIAALRRRDWVWLASVAGAGGLFVAWYASGQGAEAGSSFAAARLAPLDATRLALTYLALPWARLSPSFAWIVGVAVAVGALAAVALRGGRKAGRSERIAVAFILFSLGTAAMAGLGRTGAPDALNVPVRYAVLLTPLHVGALMLLSPWLARLESARIGRALAPALLLALLAHNGGMSLQAVRAGDRTRAAIAAFARGAPPTPEMRLIVHPDLDEARRIYADMRRDGLFRREADLMTSGQPR